MSSAEGTAPLPRMGTVLVTSPSPTSFFTFLGRSIGICSTWCAVGSVQHIISIRGCSCTVTQFLLSGCHHSRSLPLTSLLVSSNSTSTTKLLEPADDDMLVVSQSGTHAC